MICPYCEYELEYHDYYFKGNYEAYNKGHSNSGFKKLGDIYRCPNEDCESQVFNGHFHTRGDNDELIEGHPC
jgi:hypothetical protein